MDDKTDIERTLIEEKYINNNAKFKIGDVVCVENTNGLNVGNIANINVVDVFNSVTIYYTINIYNYGFQIYSENMIKKIFNLPADNSLLPPIEF